MNVYTSDYWCVLKMQHSSGPVYKLFGTWSGDYLHGGSWRLNSGIKQAALDKDEAFYNFIGNSGSIYRCNKGFYGVALPFVGMLKHWTDNSKVEFLSESTDWLTKDWTK